MMYVAKAKNSKAKAKHTAQIEISKNMKNKGNAESVQNPIVLK